MTRFDDIATERLTLRLMPKPALKALVKQDIAKAAAVLAVEPDEGLRDLQHLAAMRLKQIAADAGYLPWSLRAIILKGTRRLAGYCNFHAAPGANGLASCAARTAELGYTVFPAHRRKGYAFEAIAGMMAWARPRGAGTLILSVSPENVPSLRLAEKLGAKKIGEQIDDEDGLEFVFAVSFAEGESHSAT